ncbi:hypothetical protein GW17_00024569 [Ensete ventricosum]|nr:hypothetical protein GW17_00024569 [Ensete ventricosum]RZS17983.1 hypothetical protein BHM03_00050206 [Ensete ventricosum]
MKMITEQGHGGGGTRTCAGCHRKISGRRRTDPWRGCPRRSSGGCCRRHGAIRPWRSSSWMKAGKLDLKEENKNQGCRTKRGDQRQMYEHPSTRPAVPRKRLRASGLRRKMESMGGAELWIPAPSS